MVEISGGLVSEQAVADSLIGSSVHATGWSNPVPAGILRREGRSLGLSGVHS
jgi:hypothetical protein